MVTQGVDLSPSDLTGLKYLDRLLPMLARLHDVGCARDRAGNRRLHYDQYCLLVLLALFNPVVRSLRAIQQASTLRKVQQRLGCPRTSLGALSEAADVFDPTRLEAIIGELRQEVPRRRAIGGAAVPHVLTAVDGSVVRTLAGLAEAAYLTDVAEEHPLSEAARRAQVIGDKVVRLGYKDQRPDHPVRVVLVRATPHKKTGGRKGGTAGPSCDGILRIATNLVGVPPEVIADIYRHRWTVELFFRFFKHVLGCRRLLSQDPVGIQIQAYCAIIACLLIHLWTGGRPTLRSYEMICFYLSGWADLDELTAHRERVAKQGDAKKPN